MSKVDSSFQGSTNQYTITMWVNHNSIWNNTDDHFRIALRISNPANTAGAYFFFCSHLILQLTFRTGTGEEKVFVHMTNLMTSPTDSPIFAASSTETGAISMSHTGWVN